ncbi:hypothetical protein I79_011512 [Cricetulus griseus]|uniref:Uncharacterized protein n=1 Tax=Cricetulus griseus TaxID=10029 RepID=G3HLC5_CRIGR|nr:hypothetical protein I79_011512 [Cricetulus griseus]
MVTIYNYCSIKSFIIKEHLLTCYIIPHINTEGCFNCSLISLDPSIVLKYFKSDPEWILVYQRTRSMWLAECNALFQS